MLSLTQPGLDKAKISTNIIDLIVQYWNDDNTDIIRKIFTTGDEQDSIQPGIGYKIASGLVCEWVELGKLSIEKVLRIDTYVLAAVLSMKELLEAKES